MKRREFECFYCDQKKLPMAKYGPRCPDCGAVVVAEKTDREIVRALGIRTANRTKEDDGE